MPTAKRAGVQKLSRSKIELFLECPRCFWLDVMHGIKRPPPAPYTINSAIDYLLKQEFDVHREKGTRHPIMEKHGVDAIPFQHNQMDKWRHNFTGVQYLHEPTGIMIYGAVDDVWVNPKGELIVVDYKATGAKEHHIYESYQRQMEVYQWLLHSNGFEVSPTGYFVFARVNKAGGFGMGEANLNFGIYVEPCQGNSVWVDGAVKNAAKLLGLTQCPPASAECEYCAYRKAAGETLQALQKRV